jgi:ribosomal protein S18 acetylase RimI-like enzyme
VQAESEILSTVTIRKGCEADLPALEWEGEYCHFRQVYRRAMEEALRGLRAILVAEAEGRLVGQLFIQFRGSDISRGSRGRYGYLHAFRVRPSYRNLGIGTRLVAEAESILRARGCTRAMIAVARANPSALALYQRLGYAVTGDDPGKWSYLDHQGRVCHVHEPSYVLEKPLPPAPPLQ